MIPRFDYVRPRRLEEALERLARPGARVHAGGTDLLGCLRDGVLQASALVSLSDLQELKGIEEGLDGGLILGALTPLATIAEDERIRRDHGALAQAAGEVASPQLRNQGTLGGNLCQRPRCWYYRGDFECLRKGGDTCFAIGGRNERHALFGVDGCCYVHPSDTAPALVALGASVRVAGPGRRRSVPLAEFFVPPSTDVERETVLGPGEIVTAITLPAAERGQRSSYGKIRERGSWDFALVGLALDLRFQGGVVLRARAVASGVAAVPWRLREVEDTVVGTALDDATVGRAGEAAATGAEPLEHNGFKQAMLRGLVERQLRGLRG